MSLNDDNEMENILCESSEEDNSPMFSPTEVNEAGDSEEHKKEETKNEENLNDKHDVEESKDGAEVVLIESKQKITEKSGAK